jgi:hypothetical protein
MADKDLNIVKPVDGLQNIAGLTPARRREERKRRQNLHEKKQKESEQQHLLKTKMATIPMVPGLTIVLD